MSQLNTVWVARRACSHCEEVFGQSLHLTKEGAMQSCRVMASENGDEISGFYERYGSFVAHTDSIVEYVVYESDVNP